MKTTTNRLIIRNLHSDDWKEMKSIWQDFGKSVFAQYDVPHSNDNHKIQNLVKLFSESNDFYLVLLSDTEKVIGTVELHDTGNGYEIGYCFLSEYQGKGYAKESCNALIDLYVQKGGKRFTAGTALKNTPSVKLLLSLGFERSGTEQVSFYKDEEGNDIYFEGGIFELLK